MKRTILTLSIITLFSAGTALAGDGHLHTERGKKQSKSSTEKKCSTCDKAEKDCNCDHEEKHQDGDGHDHKEKKKGSK